MALAADQQPLSAANVSRVRNQLTSFISAYEAQANQLNSLIGVLSEELASTQQVAALKASRTRVDDLIGKARIVASTGRYYDGSALTARKVRIMFMGLGEALQDYGNAATEVAKFNVGELWKTGAGKLLDLGKDLIDLTLAGPKFLIQLAIFGAVGLVAVFTVPPILRAITAYRRGGTNAALDSSAASLESARGQISAGAKRAGSAGAKAAAAYASGGATLSIPSMNPLAGYRRTRRSSRR
jgi:hypothetical protein